MSRNSSTLISVRSEEDTITVAVRTRFEPEDAPTNLAKWLNSDVVEIFFGAVIAVNAIVIGVQIEVDLRFGDGHAAYYICYGLQCLFLMVFVIELTLRMCAERSRMFWRRMPKVDCEESCWTKMVRQLGRIRLEGYFDVAVVVISVTDLWVLAPMTLFARVDADALGNNLQAAATLRILQLLRLARIVRVLRISRELSLLVMGLAMSLKAVFWVFMLLLVVVYIGGLICSVELGRSENVDLQETFGSLFASIYAHFKIITLESWPNICKWAMQENPAWVVYFLGFILITNLTLVNVITGLVMDGVLENAKDEDWSSEQMIVEAAPFVEIVSDIIKQQDADSDGQLDQQEFAELLHNETFQKVVAIYGISLHIDPKDLFEILDTHNAKTLSVRELAGALLRLRGSRESLHPLLVRDDLCKASRRLAGNIDDCRIELCSRFDKEVKAIEKRLGNRLRELERRVVGSGGLPKEALEEAGDDDEDRPQHLEDGGNASETEGCLPGCAPRGVNGNRDTEAERLAREQRVKEEQRLEEEAREAERQAGARVVDLLKRVAAEAREVDEAIRRAEAELSASRAREAELEHQVARKFGREARSAQTEAHVPAAEGPAGGAKEAACGSGSPGGPDAAVSSAPSAQRGRSNSLSVVGNGDLQLQALQQREQRRRHSTPNAAAAVAAAAAAAAVDPAALRAGFRERRPSQLADDVDAGDSVAVAPAVSPAASAEAPETSADKSELAEVQVGENQADALVQSSTSGAAATFAAAESVVAEAPNTSSAADDVVASSEVVGAAVAASDAVDSTSHDAPQANSAVCVPEGSLLSPRASSKEVPAKGEAEAEATPSNGTASARAASAASATAAFRSEAVSAAPSSKVPTEASREANRDVAEDASERGGDEVVQAAVSAAPVSRAFTDTAAAGAASRSASVPREQPALAASKSATDTAAAQRPLHRGSSAPPARAGSTVSASSSATLNSAAARALAARAAAAAKGKGKGKGKDFVKGKGDGSGKGKGEASGKGRGKGDGLKSSGSVGSSPKGGGSKGSKSEGVKGEGAKGKTKLEAQR